MMVFRLFVFQKASGTYVVQQMGFAPPKFPNGPYSRGWHDIHLTDTSYRTALLCLL